MRRRLFTLASAVSLLLCVATVVLWVRSYSRMCGAKIDSVGFEFGLLTLENRIEFFYWDYRTYTPSRALMGGWRVLADAPAHDGPVWRWWNLGFGYEDANAGIAGGSIYVPYWSIVTSAAFFPALWFRSRQGPPKGQCLNRRYDLTGNTRGVCPECGTAVAGKVEA